MLIILQVERFGSISSLTEINPLFPINYSDTFGIILVTYIYSGYKLFIRCILCKYFLLLCRQLFHSVDFSHCLQVYQFDVIALTCFCLCFQCFQYCIHTPDKELIFKIHKQILKLNSNKINNSFSKCAKDINGHISK